jgi:TatD DNase family protein
MELFDPDLDAVISRAREAGMIGATLVASSSKSYGKAGLLVREHPEFRLALGVSPFEADAWENLQPMLAHAAEDPVVVAIGECGLDYYWDISSPSVQKECLSGQIRLAAELGLPVIIHCRDAWDDMRYAIDDAHKTFGKRVRGVIHCFTGLPDDAAFFVKRGFYISFAGNLTYRKSEDLRRALASLPLSSVLFETDAPYLAPIKHRGERCEPAFVYETIMFASNLLNRPSAEIAAAAISNANELFRRLP